MKRKKEGEEWFGKISYQSHEEEIEEPADVEKKIREGPVYVLRLVEQEFLNEGQRVDVPFSLFARVFCLLFMCENHRL